MKTNTILSILLAEDNPINSKLAQINIERMGHQLDIVENGVEAVYKFRNHEYDIILMDVDMPIMNGFEATKTIRSLEDKMGKNHKVKIIAMTAYGSEERDKILASGMDSYFCKPFKQIDLIKLLEVNSINKNYSSFLPI